METISRAEALALSLPRYHGRPCKLGHIERFTANFGCVKCQQAARKARYAADPEFRARILRERAEYLARRARRSRRRRRA
jgi:hypothetical protein